jgi:hypothetical protein
MNLAAISAKCDIVSMPYAAPSFLTAFTPMDPPPVLSVRIFKKRFCE